MMKLAIFLLFHSLFLMMRLLYLEVVRMSLILDVAGVHYYETFKATTLGVMALI